MTNDAIIRAWKDNLYRDSLSDAEKSMLPANPAGMVEISEQQLDHVGGETTLPCGIIISIVTATVAFSCVYWCPKEPPAM